MLGYQGVVSPSSPQHQSGTALSSVHTGLPSATRQMRHRGIDGDEQLQLVDD